MLPERNHSVVITGASRGIGRRIALAFAEHTDYALLLIARTKDDLEETRRLCNSKGNNKIEVLPCDTSNAEKVRSTRLPEDFPTSKIIINNAGSFLLKKLQETSTVEFSQQIQANLMSAVNTTNRFLDDLKQQPHSYIINICSVSALEGRKDSGAYSASKHALLGYTRSLRKELMDTEVAVTALNLGQTESSSWDGSSMDRSLLIDPDDVARLILSITSLSPRTVVEEMIVKPKHGRVPPM
ncbi:SDR family NAD(P)-dependent oxidoreductase [Fodinibius salsisoli]|uniref:SDR family oxidoreductase n=1 Tax=Fodinibius salsisoli TaxID=2820877 RepID=A0ABT3PQV7_9BACT|nr:SDR family oxidoreductase [Fodinibius salsisoli]MCW9708221.1 SDR family oxidoreductase [Fodinibius salsisoli]